MSETKIGKIVLGILISLIFIVASTQVLADTDFRDLTGTLNNTVNNTSAGNNQVGNNLTGNSSVLTTNNTVNNTNNSALPNTGIEDSMPVTVLVVVLGISAVYAYKKIQEYKNI